ncbi:MAG TPA: outer membrane beta-barrel protein [Chitinophagaceae bacterium]|nr:outer membrane beta-barrel protein [Chitinophagaceae bacterium]
MLESEFDKQVQQELEGLQLRPSTAVWENVEKELRRKKRRRYIVFFWLLTGLGLLGYTGYLLTQKGKPILAESSGKPADHSAKTVQQPAAQSTPSDIIPSIPSTIKPTDSSNPVDQAMPLNETSPAVATQSGTPADQELNDRKTTALVPADKNNRKRKTDKTEFPVAKSGNQEKANTQEIKETESRKETESKPDDVAGQTPPAATVKDSSKTKIDSAVAAVPPPAETKPPVAKKQSSSKIRWSLDLGAGGSGPISSPFLIGESNKSALAYNQTSGMIVSPGSPLVTPPVVNYGPVYFPRSDIKPGPTFRIGVLGEWAISKRSSIVSGLQYQYLSTNIRTGSYRNTALTFDNYASQPVSVRSSYQAGLQKTFTNRFHYLQIPLEFQWQVNKGNKMPVLVHAGMSAGYLLTTNALVYDSLQGGIYYHDKNAFNHFQLSFNTGLAFRFGNNKAFQWNIGPEASMGLRSQVKEEYDKKQYPLYLGIRARLYWPKKNH